MSTNPGAKGYYTDKVVEKYQIGEQVMLRQDVAVYLATETQRPSSLYFVVATNEDGQSHRLKRQMDTLAQLSHPGLPTVLATGVTPEKHAYAFVERVDGATLAERLVNGPPFTTVEALELAQQVADILAVVHPAGIVHQELTPAQVTWRPDGVPVLLHLGVPACERPLPTTTTQIDYLAPEQLAGQPPSAQSNIYSLGVILYEMLAGQPPYVPQSEWDMSDPTRPRAPIPLPEVRPGLTAVTYHLVRTCLLYHEWSRFDTTEELIVALQKALMAETTAQNTSANPFAHIDRRKLFISLGVIILLSVVMGGFLLLFR
jgi:serine/threonine protein kinase